MLDLSAMTLACHEVGFVTFCEAQHTCMACFSALVHDEWHSIHIFQRKDLKTFQRAACHQLVCGGSAISQTEQPNVGLLCHWHITIKCTLIFKQEKRKKHFQTYANCNLFLTSKWHVVTCALLLEHFDVRLLLSARISFVRSWWLLLHRAVEWNCPCQIYDTTFYIPLLASFLAEALHKLLTI